ncbi:TIR domain-containing protein [Rubrivivax sp. A210]|uniref:toll/interleukin-1 receptor domain-containing protein n=1 Tax=Rubrivivax sp. A210 TaxID=2772301 RepID=UPI001917B8E5|nr:toll/interleukin-1 receptor domain-containing protein [Rubrivivax sp. A210]CAD5374890.1 TIR domain-containing protein [Rubrivivax sp. A210]
MRPVQIFISYRRDDSAGYARALYDELARHFGADRVFIDVDDIAAGQAFADVIAQAVGQSRVVLVLIGPRWLGERPGQPPRLADAGDFVHREIAGALAQGLTLVPLLLDGARMPEPALLPPPLRALASHNAMEISPTNYADAMQRLVARLRSLLGEAAAPPSNRRRLGLVAGAAVLAAGSGAAWLFRGTGAPKAAVPARAARPAINGRWQAEVDYDWPGAHYVERFEFSGEGDELSGSASFLRVPRGLLEGRLLPDGLSFITRTTETAGGAEVTATHRYRGRLAGDEIRFVMQTEGGLSSHRPIEFIARRVP